MPTEAITPDPTEAALIRAVQAGDAAAFEPLVDTHLDSLRAFIALKLPLAHLVDELAHETFVFAFRNLAGFTAGTSFRAWLRAIAANLIRAELQRYAREQPQNLPELQRLWVEQWIDPYFIRLYECIRDGLDEYGAESTEFQREQMRWLFLRGTQWQIGTFDAAWNVSDPWFGEGDESGVTADAPWLR